MNKKQLLIIMPILLLGSSIMGCKSGGGDTPTPTPVVDKLEYITVNIKSSSYYVGDEFDKKDMNVYAKYSQSGTKTLNDEDYTVDVTLPYKFKEEDIANGKTFTISYSGKSTTATATVQENIFKKIDWNTNKVHNNKTLYELAKTYDGIIFGKKSEYETQVSSLTSFNVDEENKGYVKAYISEEVQNIGPTIFILVESDKHVIQFDENDRIEDSTVTKGPFFNLNSSLIQFSKRIMIEFKDFSYMFADSQNLLKINGIDLIPPFDVSTVKNMSHMFDGCKALTELDLHGFSTDNVNKYDYMFNGCTQLKTIYASKYFNIKSSATSENMFTGCTSLVGGNNTSYSSDHTDGEYARIDTSDTPGYFTEKKDS